MTFEKEQRKRELFHRHRKNIQRTVEELAKNLGKKILATYL